MTTETVSTNEIMDFSEELQQRFHRDIALTQHMGLQVDEYSDIGLVLSAPLARNLNHKQTAFGGSLNSLVTLAGWGMVYLVLKEMGREAHIIIQESEISYLRPVTDDFQAICPPAQDEALHKFQRMIRKKNIGRITLPCFIYHEKELAVSFQGSYVATVSSER